MLALVIALIILSVVCYIGQGFIAEKTAAILSENLTDLIER